MNAETFERAAAVVMHRKLAQHEAGHAAGALLGGLTISEAAARFASFASFLQEPDDPDEAAGEVVIETSGVRDDPDRMRALAIAVLCGPLCEGKAAPTWPLSLAPMSSDERQVGDLVRRLDLDQRGYAALVQDAHELVCSREFDRLHVVVAELLERHGSLAGPTLERVKHIAEGAAVEHMTLKAVTTADTDQGTFEAVISTATIDRERDVVVPEAMVKALRAWTKTGKLIPLAWNHSSNAEDIIGHVTPDTVKAVGDEVVASGWIDQATDRGAHAWRLVKSGTLGFSFGYLILDAAKLADGVREIRELDVFEVSATPTPMNGDTRVLGWKAAGVGDDLEYERIKRRTRDEMFALLGASDGAGGDMLRAKANRVAREHAPVQIASFEC